MSLNRFNVQIEGRTFAIDIEELHARPVVVTVDGQRFEVWPNEENGAAETVAPSTNGAHLASVPPAANALPTAPRPLPTSNGNGNGHTNGNGNTTAEVRSPLPGVIVSVAVRAGDSVDTGQELLALEAMKMKNLIRATRPGKIAEVLVATGQSVKHRELLVRYAD